MATPPDGPNVAAHRFLQSIDDCQFKKKNQKKTASRAVKNVTFIAMEMEMEMSGAWKEQKAAAAVAAKRNALIGYRRRRRHWKAAAHTRTVEIDSQHSTARAGLGPRWNSNNINSNNTEMATEPVAIYRTSAARWLWRTVRLEWTIHCQCCCCCSFMEKLFFKKEKNVTLRPWDAYRRPQNGSKQTAKNEKKTK